ncbi:MAG: hypothetical protein IJ730_00325 [Alphaproteobacteria bacterium]|nr:hypothetical protein [Alphaproteobacteria bacterium]
MLISIIKIIASITFIAIAAYYGGSVVFIIGGKNIELHIAVVILALLLLMYFYGATKSIIRKICIFFAGKPASEKGLDYLQKAFSGILLKDRRLTEKSIEKARKYLGDIPLILWIEGQLMLAKNNQHRAKAIFYELSSKEKETALGAYSICNIAIKEHSSSDAINAIDSILKINPRAHELVFQAIVISLRNGNFSMAEKYIPSIEDTKKGRLVRAIIYAEKGKATNSPNLLKRAFKLAPELSENALLYADYLIRNKEYRSARRVLIEAFEHVQIRELHSKYILCGKNLSDSDILKLAEDFIEDVPNSWLAHYEFAKIALRNDLIKLAFKHFLIAYEKEQYDFIATKLEEVAQKLGTEVAIPKNLVSKPVRFLWKCKHCGNESSEWIPICDHCDWIGEYVYEETYELDDQLPSLSYNKNY